MGFKQGKIPKQQTTATALFTKLELCCFSALFTSFSPGSLEQFEHMNENRKKEEMRKGGGSL
jgi:hypothetical protein